MLLLFTGKENEEPEKLTCKIRCNEDSAEGDKSVEENNNNNNALALECLPLADGGAGEMTYCPSPEEEEAADESMEEWEHEQFDP